MADAAHAILTRNRCDTYLFLFLDNAARISPDVGFCPITSTLTLCNSREVTAQFFVDDTVLRQEVGGSQSTIRFASLTLPLMTVTSSFFPQLGY